MSTHIPSRKPKGSSTGGQFAATERAEADVDLSGPAQPDPVEPLGVDEWVVREDLGVRVSFTDIGEGYFGEHDEDDPDDAALLRLDVQVRGNHPHAATDDEADADEGGTWYWAQGDSSLCTNIRRDHATPEQLRRLAGQVLDRADGTHSPGGRSISGVVKEFEGATENDAPRGDLDTLTVAERTAVMTRAYDSGMPETVEWCDTCEDHEGHAAIHRPHEDNQHCLGCEDRKIADYEASTDWGDAVVPDAPGAFVDKHGIDRTPGQTPSRGHL